METSVINTTAMYAININSLKYVLLLALPLIPSWFHNKVTRGNLIFYKYL